MHSVLKALAVTVLFFLMSAVVNAGETQYEVYYFHASWRCANCTNAEAWAGEAVDLVKKANPEAGIAYIPKQLETNKSLVQKVGAKRVDVVVAEIKDGKIERFVNLGNLLPLIGDKAAVMNKVIDGIVSFGNVSGTPGLIRP